MDRWPSRRPGAHAELAVDDLVANQCHRLSEAQGGAAHTVEGRLAFDPGGQATEATSADDHETVSAMAAQVGIAAELLHGASEVVSELADGAHGEEAGRPPGGDRTHNRPPTMGNCSGLPPGLGGLTMQ